MPALTRVGDKSLGEDGYPPRPALTGSKTVFGNMKVVVIVGSKWMIHCKGLICHDATSTSGAPGVFIENKAVVRIGDKLSDKDIVAQGSPNIFIGDRSGSISKPQKTWKEMVMRWKNALFAWKDA